MEAFALDFENTSLWKGIAIANPWSLYATVSRPTKDGSNINARFLVQKGRSFTLAFSIRSSITFTNLPKLYWGWKREFKSSWSLSPAKQKGNELWGIKRYKFPHICVNPVMNMDNKLLDVLYISTLIRPLVRVELSILVATIQLLLHRSWVPTPVLSGRHGTKSENRLVWWRGVVV